MIKLKDLLDAYFETPIVKACEWDDTIMKHQPLCKPEQYDGQPEDERNCYTTEEAIGLFGERQVLSFNTVKAERESEVYLIVMLEKEENGIAN